MLSMGATTAHRCRGVTAVADTGEVSATPLLESWLRPYLSAEHRGGARRIDGLPATEAAAALSVDPGCDPGPVDGLPSVAMLAEAAIAAHPDAQLSGRLIDADRPDARLHLDTIHVTDDIELASVLQGLASVIPENLGLDFDTVSRAGGSWHIHWD
jgi:hypothetical protein